MSLTLFPFGVMVLKDLVVFKSEGESSCLILVHVCEFFFTFKDKTFSPV